MDDDPKIDSLAFAAPAQAGQPDDQDDGRDKAETLITKKWVAARFSEMFVVGAAGPRASKQQENVVSATNKRHRVRCHGRSTMHLPSTPDALCSRVPCRTFLATTSTYANDLGLSDGLLFEMHSLYPARGPKPLQWRARQSRKRVWRMLAYVPIFGL